ncbi:hypothetical protein GCM10022225_01190 [Plantactinospora mayteni]|uniref:DUF2637 domain-containing protein n=1 Tax=Plantactinospora mayteni TaxID=566021 RepID=A0ABQ4EYD1_9ACTN|nr:DUF2637 domain-containing protein [Plantactinospora mayteni]GIG99653.1 hypothetical protein Pma05_62260 [Plantactinospora mayteni]
MPLPQLRRVRWAVRAILALGVAVSVVANVLHAWDNPISQAIAAWPPLALLLTVELISRVPVHRRSLAYARMAATATIAGIAAWVSYWHMVGVAARYGETGASPYLLPLSVDGLIVVASICLVELGGRISAAQAATTVAAVRAGPADSAGAAGSARSGEFDHALGSERVAATGGAAGTRRRPAATSGGGSLGAVEPLGRGIGEILAVPSGGTETGLPDGARGTGAEAAPDAGTAARAGKAAARQAAAGPARKRASTGRAAKPRRPITETAALAAAIQAERPEASDADVAQELGITTARLRAIRREVRELDLVA